MKLTNLLLLCLCLAMVVPTAWSQSATTPAKPGILGYLDPHTGAFRPVPSDSESANPNALTTFTGTITVNLTITVKTTSLTKFSCTAEVSVIDQVETSPRGYEESADATATGSGATRTCTLTIPYAWALGTQSSDSMTISYVAFGTGTSTETARTSGLSPLDTAKVPANGATTTLTAAVTL
jgi:hypothetical protein